MKRKLVVFSVAVATVSAVVGLPSSTAKFGSEAAFESNLSSGDDLSGVLSPFQVSAGGFLAEDSGSLGYSFHSKNFLNRSDISLDSINSGQGSSVRVLPGNQLKGSGQKSIGLLGFRTQSSPFGSTSQSSGAFKSSSSSISNNYSFRQLSASNALGSSNIAKAPEPGTILGTLTALVGGGLIGRRRRKAKGAKSSSKTS